MGKLLNAFGLGLAITLMLLAQLLLSPHYRDPRLRAGASHMTECQDARRGADLRRRSARLST